MVQKDVSCDFNILKFVETCIQLLFGGMALDSFGQEYNLCITPW
jgi:hypothetical protein